LLGHPFLGHVVGSGRLENSLETKVDEILRTLDVVNELNELFGRLGEITLSLELIAVLGVPEGGGSEEVIVGLTLIVTELDLSLLCRFGFLGLFSGLGGLLSDSFFLLLSSSLLLDLFTFSLSIFLSGFLLVVSSIRSGSFLRDLSRGGGSLLGGISSRSR
jgi:hypothetical protein